MAEPKMLPPTLRDKKRYIVFEIISEKPIEYGDFVNSMWNLMLEFLGEFGTAEAKVWLIQNLYQEQKGVIKCAHDYVENVRAFLSLIQIIGETKSVVRILGVTGTIKSIKDKYMIEGKKDLMSFAKEE
ncbi:MAG TPA: Rpp14/Pop5 family protein [archaeon]|nr:Rpp14/Pop5 family protein [archaeon]